MNRLFRAIFYPFLSSKEKSLPHFDTGLGGFLFIMIFVGFPILIVWILTNPI